MTKKWNTNLIVRRICKEAAVLVVFLLCALSAVPQNYIYADEGVEDLVQTEFLQEETLLSTNINYDDEVLFEQYVDSVLYSDFSSSELDEIKKQESYALQESITTSKVNRKLLYNGLNSYQKVIYDAIASYSEKIASGEIDNTTIVIAFDDTVAGNITAALPDNIIPYSELNAQGRDDAYAKFKAELIDANRIYNALLYDCPQEFYWHDKVTGCASSYNAATIGDNIIVHGMTLRFAVSDDFGTGEMYKADVELTGASANAARVAKAVVNANEGKSDYDKLLAYKEYVCNQVSYNHSALMGKPYGNPWQMLYVFDDDPSTNVVCEGYAKAFKYLCDLSSFSSPDVECALMGGYALSGEGHMWNIVRMDDNKCYIVDATFCDTGIAGGTEELFLKGCMGKVESGRYSDSCVGYYFRYKNAGSFCGYYCFSKLAGYYADEFMNLSKEDYVVNGTESQIAGYYISVKDDLVSYNLCVSLDRHFSCNDNNYVSFDCDGNQQKVFLKDCYEKSEGGNSYYVFPIQLSGYKKADIINVTLHYYLGEECVYASGSKKGETVIYSFSVENVFDEYKNSKRYSSQVISYVKKLLALFN